MEEFTSSIYNQAKDQHKFLPATNDQNEDSSRFNKSAFNSKALAEQMGPFTEARNFSAQKAKTQKDNFVD